MSHPCAHRTAYTLRVRRSNQLYRTDNQGHLNDPRKLIFSITPLMICKAFCLQEPFWVHSNFIDRTISGKNGESQVQSSDSHDEDPCSNNRWVGVFVKVSVHAIEKTSGPWTTKHLWILTHMQCIMAFYISRRSQTVSISMRNKRKSSNL